MLERGTAEDGCARTAGPATGGDPRRLFNTSGNDYRELGIKKLLPAMSESEAVTLLAGNGNLVKRPFVCGDGIHLAGFKPDEWTQAFRK